MGGHGYGTCPATSVIGTLKTTGPELSPAEQQSEADVGGVTVAMAGKTFVRGPKW